MARPKDKHHIIPKSRCREMGIDPHFNGNIVRVSTSKHRAWHTLFGNKTPEEAIACIEDEWSLPEAGRTEFKRLTNVRFLRRKNR